MAVQFPNMFNVDVNNGAYIGPLHQMFLGDANANRVGAYLFDGETALLAGGSCSGEVILYGGGTVALTGVVSGNAVYVVLNAACYVRPGPIRVSVTWTDGTNTATVVQGFGNVNITQDGTVIDPGTIIPSVSALIADIDAAVASIPADYSDLLTTLALDEIDINTLKAATVTKKLGSEIAYTDNEEGGYWRYINGAWQKVKTSGTAYWHMVTYPVTGGHMYRVTGRHGPYTPLATYWTDDGATPIGYSPDGYSASQSSEQITLDLIIPENATKMIVTAFPLGTFPTVKEVTYTNSADTTLHNLRESALGVTFDLNVLKFTRTSTGLDITLPYRCFIFGDKTANIYEKKLNGLTSGSFDISWDLNGYIVLDITTGTVSVDTWAQITARTDPFIVFASSGKLVNIGGVYYPMFNAGALLPYFNQYMISSDESVLNQRLTPPYYYFEDDYLPDKVLDIRETAKSCDVSFGFLTDYHVGFNTGRSMLLMKYLADHTNAIPFVLFGGDVPKASGTSAECLAAGDTWLDKASVFGKDKVYQCKGNHDYMIITGESSSYHADAKTDYYYICKNTEGKVHGEAGKMYYYFDDDVNKVRYIVLDNYDAGYGSGNYNTTGMSQTQYNWLIDKLGVQGYDILVLSHQTSDATLLNYEAVLAPLQEILKAFVAKGTLSYTGNNVTLSADFSGSTSRLICHLSGHSHDDESHVDNGVLSICTVCDAYYTSPSGYTRGYSTITEQAFDVFCITKDTGSGDGSIEIIRIGAGSDRSFTF